MPSLKEMYVSFDVGTQPGLMVKVALGHRILLYPKHNFNMKNDENLRKGS